MLFDYLIACGDLAFFVLNELPDLLSSTLFNVLFNSLLGSLLNLGLIELVTSDLRPLVSLLID